MTTVMTRPPKYIEEANLVLATLASAPDATWNDTQRELADRLDMPQPIVSLRVKLLIEQGRVRRGQPLPVRGRNHALVVIDSTPLDGAIRADKPTIQGQDRALEPDEQVGAGIVLGDFTPERIGNALIQYFRDSWEREEKAKELQVQQNELVRQFRTALADKERNAKQEAIARRELEERLAALEREKESLRRTMNQLIVKVNSKQSTNRNVPMTELLDDESRALLDNLLREKPNTRYAG